MTETTAIHQADCLTADRRPLMSVVVCSYNGERTLAGCLDALASQTVRELIEIIVVDDGSTDATVAIARRFDVRVIAHDTNLGLSTARNTGIAASMAELIAFTDDDCVPAATWAESMIDAFTDHPTVQGIGGEIDALCHDSLIHRYLAENNPLRPLEIGYQDDPGLIRRLRLYLSGSVGTGLRPVFSLVGASMAFRADALDDVGGFDDRITFGGDDEDICSKVRERFGDGALIVDPKVRVEHDFDSGWSDTLRRSFMYGIGNGRKWARTGGLPSIPPSPLIAVLLCLTVLPVRRSAAPLVAAAVPALLFRRGLVDAVRGRRPERAVWPLVAFSQEVAANVGFVTGWRRSR